MKVGRPAIFNNPVKTDVVIEQETLDLIPSPRQPWIREAILEKQKGRSNNELLSHAEIAMLERMNDPKNVIKGAWGDSLKSSIDGVAEEYEEVMKEAQENIISANKLRYELADLMVQCARAILVLDKEMR